MSKEPAPEVFEVVVEIPRGSRNKYEMDHERHIIKLDRRLFSAMMYLADYGFVPDTLAEDGDPLDVLVLLDDPTSSVATSMSGPSVCSGCAMTRAPTPLLCVPAGDPRHAGIRDIGDLDEFFTSEIEHFFDIYKELEPGKMAETPASQESWRRTPNWRPAPPACRDAVQPS
jgi:inorganic pyrophosphatase